MEKKQGNNFIISRLNGQPGNILIISGAIDLTISCIKGAMISTLINIPLSQVN
jgi:hypothetical protein